MHVYNNSNLSTRGTDTSGSSSLRTQAQPDSEQPSTSAGSERLASPIAAALPPHPLSAEDVDAVVSPDLGAQSRASSHHRADLARKALVDKAYEVQAQEERAPAIDVAVMADINKQALDMRYDQTFRKNGHSGCAGNYITRAGFTALQKAYAEKKYTNEDWCGLVNDENPKVQASVTEQVAPGADVAVAPSSHPVSSSAKNDSA
jgi:hypothetical protein